MRYHKTVKRKSSKIICVCVCPFIMKLGRFVSVCLSSVNAQRSLQACVWPMLFCVLIPDKLLEGIVILWLEGEWMS